MLTQEHQLGAWTPCPLTLSMDPVRVGMYEPAASSKREIARRIQAQLVSFSRFSRIPLFLIATDQLWHVGWSIHARWTALVLLSPSICMTSPPRSALFFFFFAMHIITRLFAMIFSTFRIRVPTRVQGLEEGLVVYQVSPHL